ncbi:MAG: DUF354 domain-containing protein [Candidatus Omnitrophica bacterium]|nr:DUF354 domain-containing protein [Candidatus Omnitrophota bacterium]
MRIVVDIGHPAHVHFFKHFIHESRRQGHKILITAADKDIAFDLLDDYKFEYIKLGTTGRSLIRKVMSVPVLDWKLFRAVKKFDPDLFLGLGSIRATHVAKMLGKHSIIFNDTEATIKEHILYYPFADRVVSPRCFGRDFGAKHIRYDGYHELAYLHPDRFRPDPTVLEELGIGPHENIYIVRFIAWEATHDIGQKGFDTEGKRAIIKRLSKEGRVIITSEGELPDDLYQYHMSISPTKMHDLLAFASMYVGEGATMASEAAVLGVPVVFLSTLVHNYLHEQADEYQLIHVFNQQRPAIVKMRELLAQPDLKEEYQRRRQRMLADKVDVTAFMLDLVDTYARDYILSHR